MVSLSSSDAISSSCHHIPSSLWPCLTSTALPLPACHSNSHAHETRSAVHACLLWFRMTQHPSRHGKVFTTPGHTMPMVRQSCIRKPVSQVAAPAVCYAPAAAWQLCHWLCPGGLGGQWHGWSAPALPAWHLPAGPAGPAPAHVQT